MIFPLSCLRNGRNSGLVRQACQQPRENYSILRYRVPSTASQGSFQQVRAIDNLNTDPVESSCVCGVAIDAPIHPQCFRLSRLLAIGASSSPPNKLVVAIESRAIQTHISVAQQSQKAMASSPISNFVWRAVIAQAIRASLLVRAQATTFEFRRLNNERTHSANAPC